MYNGFNHGNTSKLLSGQLTIDTLLHTPIFSFLLPVSVSARHRDPNIPLEQRAKFPPQYCGVLIRKTSALSITIKTCLSSLFQPVFCHVENQFSIYWIFNWTLIVDIEIRSANFISNFWENAIRSRTILFGIIIYLNNFQKYKNFIQVQL